MLNPKDARARFDEAFTAMPLVAILRGVRPSEAVAIGEAILEAGIAIIEVPLNSPDPFDSVARLAKAIGDRAVIGVGTVYRPDDVEAAAKAGAALVVSPNINPQVVKRARSRGLVALPGILTPSEAMTALEAGADALKIFPAEMTPPAAVKALRAVLPMGVRLVMVGGVTPATIPAYEAAGADGYGIGSALYKPGVTPAEAGERARAFVAAVGASAAA